MEKNKGALSNLVVFLRFSDESDTIFEKPISYYETLFNDSTTGACSVYNYFKTASYNQLFWTSVFYPLADAEGKIISYQAQNSRGYYQKYSSINPDGYVDDELGMNRLYREQDLIKELSDYLDTIVPASAVIDADDNGVIDNICIIVSGKSAIGSSHLLWPHRSQLYIKSGSIQGKIVSEYIMLFDDANGYSSGIIPQAINAGVLCHEMSHTLGTYDLYHGSVRSDLNPIGVWDLMSDNLSTPQSMSAYTKYKYCKWIDEIPTISQPGLYTLNPLNGESKENIAYKISPIGSDQYFVVEYRKKEGFDIGLPESGLLIYRVDSRYSGNNAYNGTTKFDELYVFRPGGTTTSDGDIECAVFSSESGRTAFGGDAEEQPFYTNGDTAFFAIGNVSTCGETLTFELLPVASRIYLPTDTIILSGNENSTTAITVEADTTWQITSVPEWIDISPLQGSSGKTTLTLTTLTKNESDTSRRADILLTAIDEADVSATLTILQASGMILSPTNLQATQINGNVELSWSAPVSGFTVLSEDFENSASVDLWEIRHDSENPKTWIHATADNYTEVYDGTQAMKLEADFDYMHQDEWLISPVFSQGQLLDFHSKSIAPQKNNAHNFYYVLVSSDNGGTWDILYDLKTESTAINVYEEITLDLSPYQSDSMRIAFRGYDDDNEGLSYWWIVDGISIYPSADSSAILGYNIYRDGIKIATTDNCTFTDEDVPSDEMSYQVSAITQYGETALSSAVTIYMSSNITETTTNAPAYYYDWENGLLIVPDAKYVTLIRIDGQSIAPIVATKGYIDMNGYPKGFYIAHIVSTDKSCTLKFFK
ncbi:MAG: M6 family metalloprotease domain-containing protein [Porphyromonadaceae bacterium]|nr:M6 family metalloprotease domain-containing protein [Porphyromonadaceae bacterium]